MPRKPRTEAERTLHRVQIAIGDLHEASEFIEAAQAAKAKGADPATDVVHKALVCAAVIYYARPFSLNEHRNPKKRPADAADATVDLGPLHRWIQHPQRRRLHRQIIAQRNKIVAHAEGRFFEVKMVRSGRLRAVAPNKVVKEYGFRVRRLYPSFDLEAMRLNAEDLRSAYSWITQTIAPEVRRRKRLRRLHP
jgi:hypothetical protein